MTPKICHFYWGRNQALSWIQLMSVVSFRKQNPTWTIYVHTPSTPVMEQQWETPEHLTKYTGRDWFPELEKYAKVFTLDVNLPVGCSEVHRSDVLRWHLLATVGGVWCDFDVFHQKPLVTLFTHNDWDVAVCFQPALKKARFGGKLINKPTARRWIPIGLLASQPQAPGVGPQAYRDAAALALTKVNPQDYQSAGRHVLEAVVNQQTPGVYAMDFQLVYPVTPQLLSIFWNGNPSERITEAVCIHWYAGHGLSQKHMQHLNPDRVHWTDHLRKIKETWEEMQ